MATRLSIIFEGVAGRRYAAEDVRSALQTALAELDADDRGHRDHIGGFGLKQLCARLQVTSGGAPQPVMAKARGRASKKHPLEELLAWSKKQQGRVTAAVRQANRDKQVLPLLRALERAMFSDLVPSRMQWGTSPGKYPGQHIVRKLLLKCEAQIGDMHRCKQAILAARGHLVSLHSTQSLQAGCR